MKFFIAVWYELLKNLRDVKMIALLVVFPLITMYVLGTAVGSFFDTGTGERMAVAYINQDNAAIGRQFDLFLAEDEIRKRLDIQVFDDRARARSAVDAGEYAALIYLPEGLSEGIAHGEASSITVYGKGGQAFAETLVNSFASTYNTLGALVTTGGEPVPVSQEYSVKRVARIKATPTIRDYYAVLGLLQVLAFGAIFGIYITTKKEGSDIHMRMGALPVRQWVILSGRILGSTLYLMLSTAAVMVLSGVLYGINWNGNLPVMAGTMLLFCLITVGLGTVSGKLFGQFDKALLVVLPLVFFFGMASGGISPTNSINWLGVVTPNYYAKILLFGAIYGYSPRIMTESTLWLTGMAVLVFGLLAIPARRTNHDTI